MTVRQILADLQADKPMRRETLYAWMRRAGIKPVGLRARPQNYPDDSADRIRRALGLKGTRAGELGSRPGAHSNGKTKRRKP